MASAKQETIRQLMKEQKGSRKKVNHPLARYNGVGQLSCVICNLTIKSELLWTTHLQSKKHKEAVVNLKTQTSHKEAKSTTTKTTTPQSSDVPSKRRHIDEVCEDNATSLTKKTKVDQKPTELPSDFFDTGVKPAVSYSDSESENEDNGNRTVSTGNQSANSTTESKAEQREEISTSSKPNPTENKLPEGFFDDPKLDAKARHIEYKNPIDEEWEKFQKTMQQEEKVSMAMQEEDDEVANEDRELEEITEQVSCFTRAEELRLKQEKILRIKNTLKQQSSGRKATKEEEESFEDVDSDIEYDELLDWRQKRT